jgi:dynein assembly factor with WDR repeat domains 1
MVSDVMVLASPISAGNLCVPQSIVPYRVKYAGKLLLTLEGHTLELVCVAFNPTATLIATASMDHTSQLWDVESGARMCSLQLHSAEIVSATFNQAGTLLLTGSFDRTCRVWDVRTGQCVHCLEGHDGEVCSTLLQ